jgi:hypothetical protein
MHYFGTLAGNFSQQLVILFMSIFIYTNPKVIFNILKGKCSISFSLIFQAPDTDTGVLVGAAQE